MILDRLLGILWIKMNTLLAPFLCWCLYLLNFCDRDRFKEDIRLLKIPYTADIYDKVCEFMKGCNVLL